MTNGALLKPDLLFPVEEANRDEVLVVEFDGFIKNISEGILQTMMLNYATYIKRYPALEKFLDMTVDMRYEETALLNPAEFLTSLSNSLTPMEIETDLNTIIPQINYSFQRMTIFEYALINLLEQKFVKKLYFIKPSIFSQNEVSYINSHFIKFKEKIVVLKAYAYQMISHDSYATTFFMESNDELKDILNNHTADQLTGKVFTLRTTSQNTTLNVESKEITYSDKEFLMTKASENNALVAWMYPSCVPNTNTFDDHDDSIGAQG